MLKERLKHLINKYSSVDQKGKLIALKNQIALLKKGHESIDLAEKMLSQNNNIMGEIEFDLASNHTALSGQMETLSKLQDDLSEKQDLILSNEDRIRRVEREINSAKTDSNIYSDKLNGLNFELSEIYKNIETLDAESERTTQARASVQSEYESVHHQYVKCKSTTCEQKVTIERNRYLTDQLLSEINTYKAQIEEITKSIKINEENIVNQGREHSENQSMLQEVVNELNVYQHRLKRLHNHIGSNHDKLREQKKSIDYNNKEIEQVRSVLEETKHSLDLQKINMTENENKLWGQRKWLDNNTRLAHDRKHFIQRNKEVLRDQERLIENNLKRIHIAKGHCQEEEVTLNIQQITLDNNKREIATVKKELRYQEETLATQRQQQTDHEISIIKMGTLTHTLDKALKSRYEKIDQAKIDIAKQVKELNASNAILVTRKDALRTKNAELTRADEAISFHRNRLIEQSNKLKQLEATAIEQDHLLKDYTAKLNEVKLKSRENTGQISNREVEIREGRIQITSLKGEIEELAYMQQRYESKAFANQKLHAEQQIELSELSSEYIAMKASLDLIQDEIGELEYSISCSSKKIQELRSQKSSVILAHKETTSKSDNLKREVVDVEKQLMQQNSEHERLKNSLNYGEKDIAKLTLFVSESKVLLSEQGEVLSRYDSELDQKNQLKVKLQIDLGTVEESVKSSSEELLKVYTQIDEANSEISSLEQSLTVGESKLEGLSAIKNMLYQHLDSQDTALLEIYKKIDTTNIKIRDEQNVIAFPAIPKVIPSFESIVEKKFTELYPTAAIKLTRADDIVTITVSGLKHSQGEIVTVLKNMISGEKFITCGGIQLAKNSQGKLSAFRISLDVIKSTMPKVDLRKVA